MLDTGVWLRNVLAKTTSPRRIRVAETADVASLTGFALVAVGVGLMYLRAGMIAGGAMLAWCAC